MKFFYSILLYTKTFSKHFKKEIVSKKALFSKSNPRRGMAIDPRKELNLFLRKSIVTACLCFNKHFWLSEIVFDSSEKQLKW